MALDTRLIGQALGEGRPIDVAAAVQPAVAKGERAFAIAAAKKQAAEKEEKAENQRRESLQARAIAQLKDFDKTKVPAQIRSYITEEAFKLKQAALNVIKNKNIDPVTAQMEIQSYMGQINDLSAKANDFKEWMTLFADTSNEDLSGLNTSTIKGKVNDIAAGNFVVKNGMFKFNDGSEYSYDDMLKIRHVNKRSDSYMKTLGVLEKIGLKAGAEGLNSDLFKANLDAELKGLNLTDADYASIAVDYLGMDASTELGQKIKEDFESDGSFDDPDLKKKVFDFVTEEFKKAANSTYSKGKKSYDEKVAIKDIKKPDPTRATGQQLAIDLITSPVERFREVTSTPSSFDKKTGIFTFGVDEEKQEYNMSNPSDIMRLAREIMQNEGETASNKSKILASLKEFLSTNKDKLEQLNAQTFEARTQDTVDNVLDQIESLDMYEKYKEK